jgi:hypothetical protein
MEHHKHRHIYREQDVDRLISQFGNKPPEETRRKTREDLSWQKEKFLALERIRHRNQQRQRGRADGRER